MHHRSVAVYDRFLANLSAILTKAEAHCTAKGIKPEAMLTFRLFPDMFPFIRQVQLACDFAARAAARLAGEPLPSTRGYGLLWSALATGAAAGGALCTIAPVWAAGCACSATLTGPSMSARP